MHLWLTYLVPRLGPRTKYQLFVDVNKASIPMDDRWQRALEEVGRGQAHPIEVTGITPEKAKLLLPLSLVKMKRL